MKRYVRLVAVVLSAVASAAYAAESKIPLNVLYLSRTDDTTRTEGFSQFLTDNFQKCLVEKRVDFRAELLQNVDVVLIDWPQDERITNKDDSPVGPLEAWDKPMVLLGSAGLLMAQAWQVIGDAG